jgi:GWxTD domain-containing protein
MRKLLLAILLFLAAVSAWPQDQRIDWINTPEAYFATPKEREEWFRLTTDAQRDTFIKRYWLMRDPTPDTAKNEFQDVVLDRIRKADARFTIKDGAVGSRTAQGQVFIVLGPPAQATTETQGPAPPPRAPSAGQAAVQSAPYEIGMQTITWKYDRFRTPNLMKMLDRPDLVLSIIVEPNRRTDTLQNPGLFNHYRDLLAEKSIANPNAEAPIAPTVTELATPRVDGEVPERVRTILKEAKGAMTSGASGVTLTAADVWLPKSGAVITVAVPNAGERTTHLTTYGEIRSGDKVVATIAAPFATTNAVASSSDSTRSTAVRVDLPPGSYDAAFAVVDDRTNEVLTSGVTPLKVADPSAAFAVSSVIVAAEPRRDVGAFHFGEVAVVPRADLSFKSSESLWYFATIQTTSPSAVKVEAVLRRGGKPIGATNMAPKLESVGTNVYLFGQELPLSSFQPGDYTLYLVFSGEGGVAEVRRADFRVVAP